MAVPSVSAISPTAGHSGGRQLVEIDGANFRLPTPQVAVGGIVPAAPPSVSVKFGGVEALEVRVVSASLLYVVTPITALSGEDLGKEGGQKSVDVVVSNIDDGGTPIAGETVTFPSGYAYALPNLTGDAESDLSRCIRMMLLELQRQVTPNLSWPVHTDFDDETADQLSISKLPTLPGLIVADATVHENAFYSLREKTEIQIDADSFVHLAPPTTVDIVLTVVGVSDNSVELANLLAAYKRFFRKNAYLRMDRDGSDPSKGFVEYEIDSREDPDSKLSIAATKDNVKHWASMLTIRGFDIESMAGVPTGGPAGTSEGAVDAGKTADSVVLEPTIRSAIQ